MSDDTYIRPGFMCDGESYWMICPRHERITEMTPERGWLMDEGEQRSMLWYRCPVCQGISKPSEVSVPPLRAVA